ncbi:MAG: hypothetical protein ABI609_00530 [Acidobacteriota bacterium]
MDELLKIRTEDEIQVDVLTLFDADALSLEEPARKTLSISLKRIREWQASPGLSEDLWALRKADASTSSLLFGSLSFNLRATPQDGITELVLSLWYQGQPIGEIPVPVCVAPAADVEAECGPHPNHVSSLAGPILGALPAELPSRPDAALHFMDLFGGHPYGVFWCEHCSDPGYHTWPLKEQTAEELAKLLREHIRQSTGAKEAVRTSGLVLYNALFPKPVRLSERLKPNDTARDRSRALAREAFARFLSDRLQHANVAGPTPRIFVRFAYGKDGDLLPIPLGLLDVDDVIHEPDVWDDAALEEDHLLGFLYAIENPLPLRFPHRGDACISRFKASLPNDGDQTLNDAIALVEEPDRLGGAIDDLGAWLAAGEEEEPLCLTLLSHHDADHGTLYSHAGGPVVTALGIDHGFASPSLVVIDACSSGHGETQSFAERFNRTGVSSVITTNADIAPDLAGRFLNCFRAELAGATESRSINEVFYKTLHCARAGDNNARQGWRALSFLLVGDGDLRFCKPEGA